MISPVQVDSRIILATLDISTGGREGSALVVFRASFHSDYQYLLSWESIVSDLDAIRWCGK